MTRIYSDWEKILFRNKQLQGAELIELQDMLLNRMSNNFNSLYSSVYSVVKGFDIRLLNYDGANYQYLITEGLIRYKDQYSVYLTVPEQTVAIPNNQRSFINLTVNQLTKEDNKDPNDGGELYGSLGSPTLYYNVDTVINEDGWPLAIIDTVNTEPYVYSFFEKRYEYDYLLNRLPQLFEDFTYRAFYEQSGNFIAKGLELKVDRPNIIPILRVTEGVAYIRGRRVEVNSTRYFQIPSSVINDDEVLYVYLDSLGNIFYRQYLLPKNSPNVFLLGSILKMGLNYQIRKSKTRALSVIDLKKIEQLNKDLRGSLIREALNYRGINLNYGNLKDTFIEVFSDLSGSDINSYLFSASISTDNRYCSLGKSSDLIELRNTQVVVDNDQSIGLFSNYIVAEHDDVTLIDQDSISEWVTLTNSINVKKGVIKLTPNSSRPAVDTKQFEVLYEVEGEINPILNATRIRLEGTGFNNEANLSIIFGSTVITEYDIISGASFSGTNSNFTVNNDGVFVIEFNVPSNLPAQNYSVVVRNETITSGAIYRVINNSGITQLNTAAINLEVTDQSVAQSFNTTDACILKWVGLYIRNVINTDLKTVAGTINVVKLINGLPTTESLGKATIFTEQVQTSEDGSLVSLFELDNPIYLPAGSYAIVISNYIETMELYSTTVNAPLINENNNSLSAVDFVDGNLFNYSANNWIRNQQQDLAFRLVKMSFKQNAVNIPITLINPVNRFSLVNSFINYIRPAGTTIEVKYRYPNQEVYETLTPNLLLADKTDRLDLLFELRSNNSNLMPLIDNNSFFITNSFNNEGTWISRTVEMEEYYDQVTVELETYLPESTKATVYISSNKGQTWEELTLDTKTLSDGRVPLYRESYSKELTSTVAFFFNDESSTFRRKFLTIRIDLESNSLNQNPYFTNVIATAT